MKLFSRRGLAAAMTAAALSTTVLAAPAMANEPATDPSDLVGISSGLFDNEKENGADPAEGSLDLFSNLSSGEDDSNLSSGDDAMGSIEDATSFLQLVSVVLTVATAGIGLFGAF